MMRTLKLLLFILIPNFVGALAGDDLPAYPLVRSGDWFHYGVEAIYVEDREGPKDISFRFSQYVVVDEVNDGVALLRIFFRPSDDVPLKPYRPAITHRLDESFTPYLFLSMYNVDEQDVKNAEKRSGKEDEFLGIDGRTRKCWREEWTATAIPPKFYQIEIEFSVWIDIHIFPPLLQATLDAYKQGKNTKTRDYSLFIKLENFGNAKNMPEDMRRAIQETPVDAKISSDAYFPPETCVNENKKE